MTKEIRIEPETARALLQQLAPFVPFSAGPGPAIFAQTLLCAQQSLPALASLVRAVDARPLATIDAQAFGLDTDGAGAAVSALAQLFRQHGSDKSTVHDYHLIYGPLLAQPDTIRGVLEIGMGTNNVEVVSNMGATGRPGASLRAFRDWCPNAAIYGADIDRAVLFEETRIRTFFADQTVPASLADLGRHIAKELDLIIDDGLHAPNANVATLTFGLSRVRRGGWIVIEDIAKRSLDVWHIVAALLPARFAPVLIRARSAFVFAVNRLN